MPTITKLIKNTLTIATLILTLSAMGAAATFTVTNTNNTGAGSLRQAVTDSNNAAGNDTIVFDPAVFSTPQTITLASSIFVSPATGESLTITGPGANLLSITGGTATTPIFNANPNFPHTFSISGVTLTMANAGAIVSSGNSNLNVSDSVFRMNTGGAITSSGTLNVTNSIFDANVGGIGGAINHSGRAAIR